MTHEPAGCLTIVVVALGCLCGAAAAQVERIKGLPDFSWAGYHAGERPLPDLAPTINVRDHGGIGDGVADDTPALKAALAAAAAKGGGVVGIPAGRWMLLDVLRIRADNVVLRGAGAGKTTLVCPKSLSQIRKPDRNWSWSGGMIEVLPPSGRTAAVARVAATATAGATEITVEHLASRPLKAGDWLEMQWFNDKGKDTLLDHLYGGVIPRGRMGPELQRANSARVREWVRIAAVDGRRLRLAQPLRIDARPAWRVTLSRRPVLREVGIEGITFEFPKTTYPGHLKEKGYNAVYVAGLVNGWVRDVRTVNADSGVILGACKHVTVSDVVLKGRMMHHCLAVSWGTDCLFTRWRIEAPHVHGTTLSWCAHGNVFSQGWGSRLAMDSHRAASFQNLHTAVTIDHGEKAANPFRSGGSGPRGPHAAGRNVYWNVDNHFTPGGGSARIKGYGEWPLGIFVGWHGNRELTMPPTKGMAQQIVDLNATAAIEDLHAWQLRKRLGR